MNARVDSEKVDDRSTNTTPDPEAMQELLVENLRDMLHAEGQLLKALPKMAAAATPRR